MTSFLIFNTFLVLDWKKQLMLPNLSCFAGKMVKLRGWGSET